MSENEEFEVNEEEGALSYDGDVEDQVVITEDEDEDGEDRGIEYDVDKGYDEEETVTSSEYEKYMGEEITEIMADEEVVDGRHEDKRDEDEREEDEREEDERDEDEESIVTIPEDVYEEKVEEEFMVRTELEEEYESSVSEERVVISPQPSEDEIPENVNEYLVEEIKQVSEDGERRKADSAKKIFTKLKFQYINIIREYGKSQKFAEKISEEDMKKIFEKFLKRQKKKKSEGADRERTFNGDLLFKMKRETECIDILDHFECMPGSKPFVKLELKQDKPTLPLHEIDERRQQFQEFLNWAYKKYGRKHEPPEKKRNTTHELVGEELRQHKKKFNLKNYNRIEGDLTLLPEVSNQVFLFSPHRDGTPEECLQVFPSGSLYVGTANILGFNGHGTYVFPNGAVYVGHFMDNMFHGFGRILYPNKTIVEGIWYQGQLMKPTVTFADGLEYDPVKWEYLESHDRRFTSEKRRGMLADNDPQLSNEHPARAMPPGCYDTGEGFYSIKTKYLYHPITGDVIRIPSKQEAEWIMKNCRSNIDENVPFSTEYLPAQFDSQLNRTELVVDRNWHKMNFPEHLADVGEQTRSEIIEDLFGNNYLTLEQMSQLSVPALRTEERGKRENWTCIPKHRYINQRYLRCLPSSVIKLLFTRSGDPCQAEQDESIDNLEEINESMTENNRFRLKKFIRTLQTINDFIQGKDIEWNNKLENSIKDAIKVLQMFDDAFIGRSIKFKKVFRKTDKRFLKNVLALWLKYGEQPSDMKEFKEVVENIRRYKKCKHIKKVSEEESSDSNISEGSLYRLHPLLELSKTRYQQSKTRKKMRAHTRLITTNAKKRS